VTSSSGLGWLVWLPAAIVLLRRRQRRRAQ